MTAESGAQGSPLFELDRYLIRRKVFKIFGAGFHVYDGDRVVAFSHQKAFKLKEDIRVYTDEAKTQELLSIRARQVIDFSAAYDIIDGVSQQKIGGARRKGFRSIMRDSWEVLDVDDQTIGTLQEDSTLMALVRRLLSNLVPQTFHLDVPGSEPIVFRQHFNPFIYRLEVTVPRQCSLDRQLVFGLAVLICAIEGRQE